MNANPIDYPRVLFSETQRFGGYAVWLVPFLLTVIPIGLMFVLFRVTHFNANQMPRAFWLFLGVMFILLPLVFLFAYLTVTVKTDQTVVQFFVFRRRIPHVQVSAFEPMKYHWTDFGGWGAKWDGDKTWAYTVSGDRAIRLHLINGKRVVIGSQRADELASALEEAGITRMPERKFTPPA